MRLSKPLLNILTQTLLENTAIVRKTLSFKVESSKADAWGIFPEEEAFWMEMFGQSYTTAAGLLVVRSRRTVEKDAYAKAYKHLQRLKERSKPTPNLPYKSLSVLVASDAQVQAGFDLVAGRPFIYLHSEKGYFLGTNGISSTGLTAADIPTLGIASDDQILDYLKALSPQEMTAIVTHPYFGEIRQAALTVDDDEDEQEADASIVSVTEKAT